MTAHRTLRATANGRCWRRTRCTAPIRPAGVIRSRRIRIAGRISAIATASFTARAFRRLSHKTQVFTGEMGDYHRTRLTHTLEVASIARTIARALRLNEDLVEASRWPTTSGIRRSVTRAKTCSMNACGTTAASITTRRRCGFASCWKRAIRISRAEPLVRSAGRPAAAGRKRRQAAGRRVDQSPLAGSASRRCGRQHCLRRARCRRRARTRSARRWSNLLELPLWREARRARRAIHAKLDDRQLRRAIVHEVIDWQVSDVIERSQRALAERRIESVADVRKAAANRSAVRRAGRKKERT